jgi:hypothetical protein
METLANNAAWEALVEDLENLENQAWEIACEEFNGWVQLGGDTSRCVQDFVGAHGTTDIIESYEEDAARLRAESSDCIFPAVLPEVAERTAQAWNRFRAVIRGEAA